MMEFLSNFVLTPILVLNCLFLILLVLIQLPKKEAGAGIAFGGGATDALFGAGSGTALTKITKYSAGLFMGLALVLSIINANRAQKRSIDDELLKKAASAPVMTNAPAAITSAVPAFQVTTPTNVAPAASTNPAPAPAPGK